MPSIPTQSLQKVRQGAAYQQKENCIYNRFNVHRDLDGNSDINLHIDTFERVTSFFKYLGSTLADNGDLDAKIR